MTLIERWRKMEDAEILKEIQMLFMNFSNAISMFTVDENYDQIKYCIDHSNNHEIQTYGKSPGICYSEKTARNIIKQILLDYAFILIPFFRSDMPTVDLGVQNLREPIAFHRDADGCEREIREAVFVFEKTKNQVGFSISKIIPLI